MPRIPRIDTPVRTITSEGSGRTISEGSGLGAGLQALGSAATQTGEMFKAANDLAQKTKAQNDYYAKAQDIQARADADPDLSEESIAKYNTEFDTAASDATSLVKDATERNQFGLELQGKAEMSKARVQGSFQKKIVGQLKANHDVSLENLQNDYIQGNEKDKQLAIADRNGLIHAGAKAGLYEPGEVTEKIHDLDKQWSKGQVNYDIATNPEMAKQLLEEKAYPNVDEADRVKLLENSKAAIRQNKDNAEKDFEQNQISHEADYLTNFASGKMSWMSADDISRDFANGNVSEKFANTMINVIKAQGTYVPDLSEQNENYPEFVEGILKAKDNKELRESLVNLLNDHKNISQEKLGVLINSALERGKSLPLDRKKLSPGEKEKASPLQREIDSGAQATLDHGRRIGLSPIETSDLYEGYAMNVAEGKAPMEAFRKAIGAQAILKNPAILRIPAEGQIWTDSNGSKAKMFPDGHWEEADAKVSSPSAPGKSTSKPKAPAGK